LWHRNPSRYRFVDDREGAYPIAEGFAFVGGLTASPVCEGEKHAEACDGGDQNQFSSGGHELILLWGSLTCNTLRVPETWRDGKLQRLIWLRE
jgi:hypothetical protein